MRWVTRRPVRTQGAATAWLVRRFVDTDAEFVAVDPGEVAAFQTHEGAQGFDAPGATWPPADGKGRTPFEQIVQQYCFSDHVLREMGRIVGSAEDPGRAGETAEGAGLRAICAGFPLVTGGDDHETLARSVFLFDALYASLAARMRADPE